MAQKFNTGKVIIGSCYEPPLTPESDPDMLRLQRSMLPPPLHVDGRNDFAADIALYVVSAIALVVVILT